MATGVELATAWVRLVPSVEGIEKSLANEFAGASDAVGKEGTKAGGLFSSKLKKALGAAAIGAGVVAAFKGLYEVGATFDDVADTIRIGTGATGDALEGLIGVAKNVGGSVPVDFAKAGAAVADINTRLGLSGDTLETVAKQYLEAGRILGQDVDVNKTTKAFSAFRVEGAAVEGGMDSLFRISQATGVSINDLATTTANAAPMVLNLGFSFEDTAALVGTLDKAGLDANKMLATLGPGLVNMAKDGEQPAEVFPRIVGELQDFIDKGDAASAINLAGGIFGTRGAAQFVAALQSGAVNMDDLMASTGATGDTILGVADETNDFAEKWQITMNKATLAIEPLATAIFEGLSGAMDSLMPVLTDVGNWVGENTEVIGVIAGIIGVTLVGAFVAWTASVWASTAALLANPITWIVLLIAGLVAAIVWVATQTTFFQDLWEGAMAVIGAVATWLWETILKPVFDAIGAIFQWLWDWIILPVITGIMLYIGLWAAIFEWLWNEVLSPIFEGIGAVFTWIWDTIIMPIIDLIVGYIQMWAGVFTWLYENVMKPVFDGIAAAFDWVWNNVIRPVVDFINAAIDTVGSTIEDVFGGIADFIGAAFEAVLGVVRTPINAIISLINGVIDGLNSISVDIPDWVPIVGGQTFGLSIPKIPMLADGGTILREGVAIVGEEGPEMVRLPAGAVVDPDIAGGGPTIIYHAAPNQSFDAEQDLWVALQRREVFV